MSYIQSNPDNSNLQGKRICGKQHKPPVINYAYDSSMENSKFNVSDAAVSSPEFLLKGSKNASTYRG